MKTYYSFNSENKMVACRANNKKDAANKMNVKSYKVMISACDLDYCDNCIKL